MGTTGSFAIPCGIPYSGTTSYPLGLAVSPDNSTAYVVLDASDELGKINLSTNTLVSHIRVGNVPHSVVVSADGKTAYVSNEAGRIANEQGLPALLRRHPCRRRISGRLHGHRHHFRGRPGLVYGHRQHQTGLHPTGMAFWGK